MCNWKYSLTGSVHHTQSNSLTHNYQNSLESHKEFTSYEANCMNTKINTHIRQHILIQSPQQYISKARHVYIIYLYKNFNRSM